MFALGEPMDAVNAVAAGLANAVVPLGELRQKAMAAAVALSKRPAGALRVTKKLMRETEKIQAQIDAESELFKERLKIVEAREAFAAFAERRVPIFGN
jgi:enoyl-CoA hydratase/carnithine racemase